MSDRRWFNPNLPQTLYIAQILLYIDGVFLALGLLFSGLPRGLPFLFGLIGVALYIYGAYGVANSTKVGYKVAVVASFAPIIQRTLLVLLYSLQVRTLYGGELSFILIGYGILNALFEYALIVLLLHPMSRDYQKTWFS